MSVTESQFRAAMGSFASGVTVITTVDEASTPFGLTATAFASVSKTPPRCLICVSHGAEAHPVIVRVRRFAVNVLSTEQAELSPRFATHGIDKFEGIDWIAGAATGCPILAGALASVECAVVSSLSAGDHDIFLGAIEAVTIASVDTPLLYFRGAYRELD